MHSLHSRDPLQMATVAGVSANGLEDATLCAAFYPKFAGPPRMQQTFAALSPTTLTDAMFSAFHLTFKLVVAEGSGL
jgi:hypothetical protein